MKKVILAAIMLLALGMNNSSAYAQSVVKSGNTFTQVTNKQSGSKETKTEYTYKDSKGNTYPVYLGASGKAFIKKVSKNGKEYKQYVPEIGKQINPKAYSKEGKK